MAAESEMKPATAGGRAAMIGRRMARGRRVQVMQVSRSEQDGDGRRADDGLEGCLSRKAVGSVK